MTKGTYMYLIAYALRYYGKIHKYLAKLVISGKEKYVVEVEGYNGDIILHTLCIS